MKEYATHKAKTYILNIDLAKPGFLLALHFHALWFKLINEESATLEIKDNAEFYVKGSIPEREAFFSHFKTERCKFSKSLIQTFQKPIDDFLNTIQEQLNLEGLIDEVTAPNISQPTNTPAISNAALKAVNRQEKRKKSEKSEKSEKFETVNLPQQYDELFSRLNKIMEKWDKIKSDNSIFDYKAFATEIKNLQNEVVSFTKAVLPSDK